MQSFDTAPTLNISRTTSFDAEGRIKIKLMNQGNFRKLQQIMSFRTRILEAGAVKELIEIELEKPEKNLTELIFNLLAQLCSCADGREQFLLHAAGITMISKRILRVSPSTYDRALNIFLVIARHSASNEVVLEILRVGAVSKLCMVIQADCASYLKEKARDILRLHSKVSNL